MDEAIRQKIIELINNSTNNNIIKLTEEIFLKTEDLIQNEVVISNSGDKFKILEQIEDSYQCIKLQNNEIQSFKRENLGRIIPLTRNDIRRIILTAPKPVNKKVGLPTNVKINITNTLQEKTKVEESLKQQPVIKTVEEVVKIDKEIELPKTIPFTIPFIDSNATLGTKNLQKIYLRIFTFLEIYSEYFENEKLTFKKFNNMLLDFSECINVLSKIFTALISEKKAKKKKFYTPIKNLYKIFFKEFKEEKEIKRKEKYIWFTKKISSNNYVEYISSFIEDINSEIQTNNILNFKNITVNYASNDFKETTNPTSEIKETENKKGESKEAQKQEELKESIKNRLQILLYFVELFGETTEAKILNENIGAFNRECIKQRNNLLTEIQSLKNQIQNPVDTLNPNKIAEEVTIKKEKCKDVEIQKFYARYNPILGEYQEYNFFWLSKKILIEKEDKFCVLKTPSDWKILYDDLLNNKFTYKNEKTRALIDNLCTLKELNLFS